MAPNKWIEPCKTRGPSRLTAAIHCHILEQRQRPAVQPGALHLTWRQDLLDLELPPADLTPVRTQIKPMNPGNNRDDEHLKWKAPILAAAALCSTLRILGSSYGQD
jgi:hypothetical protein